MTLAVDAIANLDLPTVTQSVTPRDTMLYALGLGFGEDPLNGDELPFVYEKELRAVPSMVNILCHPGFWAQDPRYGIDWVKVLHAEQYFEMHQPLPASGTIRGEVHVGALEDKGAEKGALLHQHKRLFNEDDGAHIATVRQTLMLRGNGGQGGFGEALPPPQPLPDRAPDHVAEVQTRPGLALLYRLNGDWNPLHADPAVAIKAGFDQPILHGLCTNGIAARTIISEFCGYDQTRIKALFVRFSRPVMPGDTLRFEFYRDGDRVQFRALVPERGITVLDRCYADLAPA